MTRKWRRIGAANLRKRIRHRLQRLVTLRLLKAPRWVVREEQVRLALYRLGEWRQAELQRKFVLPHLVPVDDYPEVRNDPRRA